MFDPLTLIGTAAAVGQIVASITTAIANLTELRHNFSEADFTINLLITELITIKAALKQIESWVKSSHRPPQDDVVTALDLSLDSCRTVMGALDQEVEDILAASSPAGNSNFINFVSRARFVSNEGKLRAHHERFRGQVTALSFLLQVMQMTPWGQAASLREPKNQRIIQKVVDDASTLPRAASSIQALSARSPFTSGLASPITSLDHQLLSSRAYANQGVQLPSRPPERINRHFIAPIAEQPESESSSATFTSFPRPQKQEPDDRHCEPACVQASSPNVANDVPHTKPAAQSTAPLRRLRLVIPQESQTREDLADRSAVSEPPSALQRTRSILRTPVEYEGPSPSELQIQAQPKSADTYQSSNKLWNVIKRKASRQNNLKTFRKQSSPTSPNHHTKRPSFDFVDRKSSIKLTSPQEDAECSLVISAQGGSRLDVQKKLNQDVHIEQTHLSTGRTALAVAAHCGHRDVVLLLLRHRAQVNCLDKALQTPLHLAASRGHVNVIELLLQQRANMEAQDREGKTALRLACEEGSIEAARLLLYSRARVNARDQNGATVLHAAAMDGNEDMVQLFREFDADIDAKDKVLMSAIHYAAERDHDGIIRTLAHKRNIDLRGRDSMTPLDFAASSGSTETVKLLLSLGANPRNKGENGMTALHWASLRGWSDAVDCLLQKRVPIDLKTANGKTPLHLAVQSRNFSTAELLIRKNANLEAFCNNSLRPLQYACKADDPDMMKLLLGSGARVQPSPSKPGNSSPLQTSVSSGSISAVKMLLEHGASVNDRDSNRDRPLCLASRYGNLEIAQMLLENGARVEYRDGCDWAPLAYAAFYGHPTIVELLLNWGAKTSRDLDNGCGWEMNPHEPLRIGFAMQYCIDEKRRQHVKSLLEEARRLDAPSGIPMKPAELDAGPRVNQMRATILSPSEMTDTLSALRLETQRPRGAASDRFHADPGASAFSRSLWGHENLRAPTSNQPPPLEIVPAASSNVPSISISPSNDSSNNANHTNTRSHKVCTSSQRSSHDSAMPVYPDLVCDLCLLQGYPTPNFQDCQGCRNVMMHSARQGIRRSSGDFMEANPPYTNNHVINGRMLVELA